MLKILKDEDPILHNKSIPIDEITPEIKKLVEAMKETMYKAPGVGLAAPQVGYNVRLFVTDPSKERNTFTVFINPKIISQQGPLVEGLEGCLSVSQWEGFVERYKKIKVRYQTLEGKTKTEAFEDFPARVIQHEYDHLEGILFPEKVAPDRLYTKAEVQKMIEDNIL